MHRRNSTRVASHATHNAGTWCSGITSALHAEGPGFNPQCVHNCCTPGMCVCFSLRQPQARPAVRSIRLRPARARKASHCLNNAREDQIFPYSLRGSNPRPMAHETIALTTELREHASALATRHQRETKVVCWRAPRRGHKTPVAIAHRPRTRANPTHNTPATTCQPCPQHPATKNTTPL